MQRAQPVLAAHYFLAYVEKYQRDRERLADTRKRGQRPARLGAPPWPAPRYHRPRQRGPPARLRFRRAELSDVSSDRDFLLEFVFDLSVIALLCPGWAEEWVLWAMTEFNSSNCRTPTARQQHHAATRRTPTCWS